MAKIEIYRASKGKELVAEKLATTATGIAAVAEAQPSFTIEVRFLDGLSDSQKAAFKLAANRWSGVITGHLPPVMVDGEVVQDVLILAQGSQIDGVGGILGQAGPTARRPANAGKAAFLPAKGTMTFDIADLLNMEQKEILNDVITHEMGHVLGIGTVWIDKGLLQGVGTIDPRFTGENAMQEYAKLVNDGAGARPVPVENVGGPGTRDSHWRELVFGNELMTGFVGSAPNPLSRLTVASLLDLGYEVDLQKAEDYKLPTPHLLAESGIAALHASTEAGIVLPSIPVTLPEESLQL